MIERGDVRSRREVRGELTCLLCTRTVAQVQGPRTQRFTPTSIRVRAREHMDAIRRMRCPYCAGRLWLQNVEDIYVERLPLEPEDFRPRRGRPPKVAKAS